MGLFQIFDPSAKPVPIGIDLGTTNSLVAWVADGNPECILDCDDDPIVPSVVAYLRDGTLNVGKPALAYLETQPSETIVSVKRLMGRGHDDAQTQRDRAYRFLPMQEGQSNVVRFAVHDRAVTPVEVSAEILRTLKRQAEDKLHAVGGAVITVPAYFDDAQRQATRDAARLAGIDVLRLLNEPTAAALAYGLDREKTQGTFAVFDLGGGTFDVTVLTLDDGVFQVRATGGDSQLGGDDLDRAIALAVLAEVGQQDTRDKSLWRACMLEARKLKHALTDADEAVFSLDHASLTLSRAVTRATFDQWIRPVVERTGPACKRVLRDAGIPAGSLDGVVLVGGSTRVPLVRAYVRELFGREGLTDIDPEQVVALGAAVQADILAGTQQNDALVVDVCPLSLGIETMGGLVEKIIARNSTIPCARAQQFTTYADGQTAFDVHVLQGERELARDCRSLAKFKLSGIAPMTAGAARLMVTLRLDENGMLTVSARDEATGNEHTVEVTPSYGLSDDDIEKMLIDSYEHAEGDIKARVLTERSVEAEQTLAATRKALVSDGELLDEDERAELDGAMAALEGALQERNAEKIRMRSEAVDRASVPLAERRMNRAIRDAMRGRSVEEVAEQVEHARGVDAHVAEHSARRDET
ncbi:MAG: Fe-S protein assembly chaperone HscA [Deltaproteobacteria bacterium]|nr:Fe-S protein assembly chaperone HscA [Deltaproteobacteria bacterium]